MLYPDLRDVEIFQSDMTYRSMIGYVNPDKLTDFYGRREQVIDEFLENNGQVGVEKEYLLNMEQKVKLPFDYKWVEG